MTTTQLLDPVLDGGIRNVNFFDGRLLTAADLRDEQRAGRTRHGHLVRALGDGVVEGLEVTLASAGAGDQTPVVSVAAGLALTRDGRSLELPSARTVSLVRSREVKPTATGTADFTDCRAVVPTAVPTATGIYVLLLGPASAFQERAPASGIDTHGRGVSCGKRYEVDGVRFRLVQLLPDALAGPSEETRREVRTLLAATDPASTSRLRNLLAHLCFGTEALLRFPADPFARASGRSTAAGRGALEELRRAGTVEPCEVPLALFVWTARGVSFLDVWSVRRRPVPPAPSELWPVATGDALAAEAEARFLQFQVHLEDLLRTASAPAVRARDHFRYLPPAGLLPIRGAGRAQGFDEATFFSGMTTRGPVLFAEGARLGSLLARSREHPPVDAGSPEFLWVYRVRQNHHPAPAAPYVVFAGGAMPYFGTARYDLSRFDLSNFEIL